MDKGLPVARRRFLAGFIYALAFLWGASSTCDRNYPLELLFSLAFSVATTSYCIADSRVRGKPLIQSFHWLIFLTWPVSVPIYLLRLHGWRRLHWTALAISGLFLSAAAGYLLTSVLTCRL